MSRAKCPECGQTITYLIARAIIEGWEDIKTDLEGNEDDIIDSGNDNTNIESYRCPECQEDVKLEDIKKIKTKKNKDKKTGWQLT